jgi:cytochrome c553
MKNIRLICWIFPLFFGACAYEEHSRDLADSQVSGVTLAKQVCSACHGVTGQSTSPQFPKLAGQQKEYLQAQLTDFKGHQRTDQTGQQYMWGFTHLTPKQIDELADYFSQQTPMVGVYHPESKELARGETIFKMGVSNGAVIPCFSCHGPNGEGNASFPRIAGQHADYLKKQIEIFKNTSQRPRGDIMKTVTHQLSEEDMLAISLYVSSLNSVKH